MKTINKIILKVNTRIWTYYLKSKIRNKDFTLITNNCIGGVIYHNLGMKFLSPTINLSIRGEDYLAFVKNLKEYTSCPLIEVTEYNSNYPVGKLIPTNHNLNPIIVYFQHYKTFSEAKEKWNIRCKRMNFNNIYFIWEFYDNLYNIDLIKQFSRLGNNYKALLHKDIEGVENSFVFKKYNNDYFGKILSPNGLSGKRYLDEFDYISFLNHIN